MHWTERRRARVNLALGLQARGWTLYGFKEDRSDSMTDYYDPASWDVIAEKGVHVVVVDVKPTNATILKRSGGYETTKRVPGNDCKPRARLTRARLRSVQCMGFSSFRFFCRYQARKLVVGIQPRLTFCVGCIVPGI